MDTLAQLNSEFETLGEAAVAERLNANAYQGPAKAVAMRWLNEKTLARASVEASVHAVVTDISTHRIVHAGQTSRAALLCAVAALLAAIGAMGLSVQTLQTVQELRKTVAATPPPSTPPSVAPSR